MLATKAFTESCVIDGIAVTLTFFPDTGVLRITDAFGRRIRETRWSSSWGNLVTTLREVTALPAKC